MRTHENKKAWLIGAGIAVLLVALAALAHLGRLPGKLELLPTSYELLEHHAYGHSDLTARRFRFANRRWHKALARISVRYVPMWQFTVLTNDGAGSFVPAFEPSVLHRNRHDSFEEYFEFMVHDMPHLNVDWKMRVTRRPTYNLSSPFSLISPSVKIPLELWESNVLDPPVRFVARPALTNELPSFLTNGATIFGGRELHYTP